MLNKAKKLISDYYQDTLERSEQIAQQTLVTAGKKKEEKQQIQMIVEEARAALTAFRDVFESDQAV